MENSTSSKHVFLKSSLLTKMEHHAVEDILDEEDFMRIKETWKYINAKKSNGAHFFIRYFKQYSSSKNYFQALKDVPCKDIDFKLVDELGIGRNVMNGLSYTLDSPEDPNSMHEKMENIALIHRKFGIKGNDFTKIQEPLMELIEDIMEKPCSKEIKQSWRKFINLLAAIIDDEKT